MRSEFVFKTFEVEQERKQEAGSRKQEAGSRKKSMRREEQRKGREASKCEEDCPLSRSTLTSKAAATPKIGRRKKWAGGRWAQASVRQARRSMGHGRGQEPRAWFSWPNNDRTRHARANRPHAVSSVAAMTGRAQRAKEEEEREPSWEDGNTNMARGG